MGEIINKHEHKSESNLSTKQLHFTLTTSGLIMWLVYPILESLSLIYSIHRNYNFTNPTVVLFKINSEKIEIETKIKKMKKI